MLTYYVNVLNNTTPTDFQFVTSATLSIGSKIRNTGIVYIVTAKPIFGPNQQAWVDVLPA
jgi:hypothetical protein